jgi:phosphate acetyltransferase
VQDSVFSEFRRKAARKPKTLVLADGDDARVVQAADIAQREGLAIPVLIGHRKSIEVEWNKSPHTGTFTCVDVSELPAGERSALTDQLASLQKFKSLSREELDKKLQDPLVLGCLLLRAGKAHGFIGGASRTTADTLRAVFSVIGLAPKTAALFGFFLLERKDFPSSDLSPVLLADCAVIPEPSPKQLAHIAIGAAEAYQFFTGRVPRVAFLSFSTAGSADHPKTEAIRQALHIAREKAPALLCDGEWQADAALDAVVAEKKGVGASPMAGRANVLITPDLQCGNIAYKLVQRLGGVRAVGPVLWGTAKPANDLSRGCSVEDIVDMMALTSLQKEHS